MFLWSAKIFDYVNQIIRILLPTIGRGAVRGYIHATDMFTLEGTKTYDVNAVLSRATLEISSRISNEFPLWNKNPSFQEYLKAYV